MEGVCIVMGFLQATIAYAVAKGENTTRLWTKPLTQRNHARKVPVYETGDPMGKVDRIHNAPAHWSTHAVSASAKVLGMFPPEEINKLGLGDKILLIGCGEIISALLLVIPLTSPLGTLLTSGFWGGAILRSHDAKRKLPLAEHSPGIDLDRCVHAGECPRVGHETARSRAVQ